MWLILTAHGARLDGEEVVVKKSVLGHSAQKMFSLVDAVEAYPEFLPWCSGTAVVHRDAQTTRATIKIAYHGASQSFTTENAKVPPQLMTIRLVEGPFRLLDGEWRFTELAEDACKIDFCLHYEFSSKLLAMLVGPVFSYIANTLVDAFVKRADKVYGD
ncbi:MAG: type II toxin-antitoxin system RatA family toxin [Pseudomonadota bacterium]